MAFECRDSLYAHIESTVQFKQITLPPRNVAIRRLDAAFLQFGSLQHLDSKTI
jgi:hypothetical protein